MKTAIVLGATGLTGSLLTKKLLADSRFDCVKVFTRRTLGFSDPKMQEYIVDFEKSELWQHEAVGDVLFSALGTTLKKAGTKEAQYRIDYGYQYLFATIAAKNKVPVYALVSAKGAAVVSSFFYMQLKGSLERDVLLLGFEKTIIAQPGLIAGNRTEKRLGERTALKLIVFFNALGLLKKYKPSAASSIAQALIDAACNDTLGVQYIDSRAIQDIA